MEAIGAILLNIFGSILNAAIATGQQKKEFAQQEKLLNQQNQFTQQMWEQTNAYNEPTAQVARLMAAGMSGGGAIGALGQQTANGASSSSAPSVNGLNGELLGLFGGLGEKAAELSNLKADTRLKNAEATRNEETLYYDLKKSEAEIEKYAAEVELTIEQTENLKILNKYADMKSQEEINQIIMNCKLIEQQTANAREDEKRMIWENFYRDNFGIDPNSKTMNQIITSSLKGDMAAVFGAFEKTVNFVFEKLKGYKQNVSNKVWEKIGIEKPTIIQDLQGGKKSLVEIFNEKSDKWIENRRKRSYNEWKKTYEKANPGKKFPDYKTWKKIHKMN